MKISLILLNVLVISCLVQCCVEKKRFSPNHPYPFICSPMSETTPNYQDSEDDAITKITTSILHDLHTRLGPTYNVALSPISIWTILAMLLEGSAGRTENELKRKLNISYRNREEGQHIIRTRIERLKNLFHDSSTEFTSLNFVISDETKSLSPQYRNIIRRYYDGLLFRVTKDKEKYEKIINGWASAATGNRIRSIVTPGALNNLILTVGNAIFFKAKWEHPFDPSLTTLMNFKDENGNIITQIPMMNQMLSLPYIYNDELESQILEIPYGDGLTSMIVILPQESARLQNVLGKMRNVSLNEITRKNMASEMVELSLPRFHVISDLNMNAVLEHDLKSLFNPREAEFPYMGNNVFVSRISHKAEIENTEEGTTSSAISTVDFAYKSSVTIFRANRPFIYIINEIKTRIPLFVGIFSNPVSGF